ncbi:hypothetical protein SAMN05518849_11830 [Sphingobium sp. AP50]|nr:hypothetical protein SAMN05518849_11830 [Sphingobium sp. AP50]
MDCPPAPRTISRTARFHRRSLNRRSPRSGHCPQRINAPAPPRLRKGSLRQSRQDPKGAWSERSGDRARCPAQTGIRPRTIPGPTDHKRPQPPRRSACHRTDPEQFEMTGAALPPFDLDRPIRVVGQILASFNPPYSAVRLFKPWPPLAQPHHPAQSQRRLAPTHRRMFSYPARNGSTLKVALEPGAKMKRHIGRSCHRHGKHCNPVHSMFLSPQRTNP